MAIDSLFNIASSALNAQLTRMNTTASNLANASTTANSEATAYKAKRVNFESIVQEAQLDGQDFKGGVRIGGIVTDKTPVPSMFDPGHPNADANGYVYGTNVNEVAEMVDMMAAARSYQNNVEVVNTAKQLMLRTLEITKA
ncbi:MAG: flagellar basal body rod protein FlgC [Aequoribacter sp.]|jgi:flagellar basal-body rod protein FlgC|uniref:flagellar basal body rod protein FlgC n=1 Tax=Aequoribacter sp. TaxID=2847771 RepID=UPI003C672D2B